MRRHSLLLLGLFAMAAPALAQTPAPAPAPASTARPQVVAFRVTTPPIIDGSLDDDAWTQAPIPTTEWESYNPLHGDRIPQHTTVWVGYDDAYFYFAFKCDDPEPGGIKTSISRRDNVWNDDWVGLSLDSLGTGQLSYHMMVNPSGIQMDLLNSIAAGEDQSPDWIWDSAGRRTDTGYSVEIRLPLQSIRFKGGQNIHMGILFWRRVSRTGVSVSWPALEPGKWVFEKNAVL
ncbi:MAG TPA: carbohydrate binding family 9 domain-containing protein, partial [Vicinamibacterales bacterium]